jgi:hypothetical protein
MMVTRPSQSTNWNTPTFTLLQVDSNNAGYTKDDAGSMTITATPPEAHIFIDGQDKGALLYQQQVIPGIDWEAYPHTYQVEVKSDGYLACSTYVEVGRGWSQQMDVVLKPDPNWYTFTGFDAPVDMNGVLNTAKSGSNIPLKWHLSDNNGYVSDPGKFSVKIETLNGCTGSLDDIEVLDTSTVSSVLTYQGSGAWHYNWKTTKSDTGCRKVYLEYHNGLKSNAALFKFK